MRGFLWLAVALLGCADSVHREPPPTDGEVSDAAFWAVAATCVDVTPEPGIEIVGFGTRVSTEVRDPLKGCVLLLARGTFRTVVATLDLPAISDWQADQLRQRLGIATATPPDAVSVVASHTHSAPLLTNDRWSLRTVDRLALEAARLPGQLARVELFVGRASIDFDINRRLIVNGIAEARPNPSGPHDPRVLVIQARSPDGAVRATIVHAVCHPNVLRGPESTRISADFVGEARMRRRDPTPWLFLQGAAGDVRSAVVDETANYFRDGTDADLQRIGEALAAAVAEATQSAVAIDGTGAARTRSLSVPMRNGDDGELTLAGARVGPLMWLTIPGEPMVEIGMGIETTLRDMFGEAVIPVVIGYANGYADYIVTEEAVPFGGYEVQRARVAPQATPAIQRALVEMGQALVAEP